MKRICIFASVALVLALALASLSAPASAALSVKLTKMRLVLGGPLGTEKLSFSATISAIFNDPPMMITLSYFDSFSLRFTLFLDKAIPPGSLSSNDGGTTWKLTNEGRASTGLERLEVMQEVVNVHIDFLDVRTSLPSVDYSLVMLCITIGADSGCGQATLQPIGNSWTINN